MAQHRSLTRLSALSIVVLMLVAVVGVSAIMAQQMPQPDKRLNQIADFGGDALYCVDDNLNPTNDTASFEYFRLLSGNGQELWLLDRATVEQGLGLIGYGWPPALLGTGQGTFGEVNMYANAAEDGTPYFIFTAFDEYGKPNLITFYGCTPVGSALAAPEPTQLS